MWRGGASEERVETLYWMEREGGPRVKKGRRSEGVEGKGGSTRESRGYCAEGGRNEMSGGLGPRRSILGEMNGRS